jgi:transcription antitermination protein NusB
MKKRSELREKCMIILYQYEMYVNSNISTDIDDIIKDNIEIDNEFVKDIVYGVINNKSDIDKLINNTLNEWSINRLDKTGAQILRIGVYELLYTDTPDIVVINEAVELAKIYTSDDLKKIINAVLDKIAKDK